MGGEPIMATVHVEPAGLDVEVAKDQTVMAAAVAQGLFWPTVCHGVAECHTCYFEVLDGEEHCDPPGRLEQAALDQFSGRSFHGGRTIRLACQAKVSGPVKVRKPGVRPAS
jgi:ferredoxin, 2Fe-2S